MEGPDLNRGRGAAWGAFAVDVPRAAAAPAAALGLAGGTRRPWRS